MILIQRDQQVDRGKQFHHRRHLGSFLSQLIRFGFDKCEDIVNDVQQLTRGCCGHHVWGGTYPPRT